MKLRKIILGMLSNFFCSGDIKLSGKMVLRKNVSHVRSIESHMRNIESRRVFLCRSKAAARDLGKRFGCGIYRFEKNLPKCLIIKNKCVPLHFQK